MSRRVKYILASVVLVAIVAAAWFLLLNPIRGDIAAIESSMEDERDKIASAKFQLSQAQATRDEGRKNQARLLELAKMVPESEEIPSLLLQIQDLADQAGIAFIAITPGDIVEPEAGDYSILPLDMEFAGTYFDVSDFVYRAEQMVAGPGRLLALKSIVLEKADAELLSSSVSPFLGVNLTLYAFLQGSTTGTTTTPPPSTGTGAGETSDSTADTTETAPQ